MQLFLGVFLLFIASCEASARDIPKIDIEATCRLAPQSGSVSSSAYQSCVRDEAEARSQLEQQWRNFSPQHQTLCAQETEVGGSPSFVDVLTCLEMARDAALSARQRR